MLFQDNTARRSFIAVSLTYALDLLGFSIAFPIIAPLLLDHNLSFFAADASEHLRNFWIGLSFSIFGIMQFVCAPIIGTAADKYGRKKTLVITVANTAFGFALTALSVYLESLPLLILGRAWTGCSSGNLGLSQSATADLTAPENRAKAFSLLIGIGSFGFMFGPFIGGKLAHPDWFHGSLPFIFGCAVTLINLLVVVFMYKETMKPSEQSNKSMFQGFVDIKDVLAIRSLRAFMISFFLFVTGWGFYMMFTPNFYVYQFRMNANQIGDAFAWLAATWTFASLILNRVLISKFRLRQLSYAATLCASIGLLLTMVASQTWELALVIALCSTGGAIAWVNLTALISDRAPADFQGRALSVTSSMWSLGQVISALVAGAIAGFSEFLPLAAGAALCMLSFTWIIFFTSKKEHTLQV